MECWLDCREWKRTHPCQRYNKVERCSRPGHFQVPLPCRFKASLSAKQLLWKWLWLILHGNETACRTHFHIKLFALRLGLKQRYKRTRKWLIATQTRRSDVTDLNYTVLFRLLWKPFVLFLFVGRLPRAKVLKVWQRNDINIV